MQADYSFPVHLEKVYTHAGVEVPRHRTVVRMDTGVPLSVVSDRYQLYTHEEVMKAVSPFVHSLGKSDVKYSLESSGAKLIATHTFMGHQINVPFAHTLHTGKVEERKVGDKIALQLHVINSYNRSTSLEFRLGSLTLRCLNGATLFKNLFQLRYNHLPQSWDRQFPKSDTVLMAFNKSENLYKAWAETEATPIIRNEVNGYLKALKLVPQKFYSSHSDQFESAETVWDLYNAVTAGVTHGSTRMSTSGRLKRMDIINGLFQSVLNKTPEDVL